MAITGTNIDIIADIPQDSLVNRNRYQVVVANRGSGSVSVLDGRNGEHLLNVDLISDAQPAQPMYVQYLRSTGELLVNDRSNNQIAFLDPTTYALNSTAPTGNGGFHMVTNLKETQIWVTNDLDDSVSVVDPTTKQVLATIDLPSDIIGANSQPHDVWLDASGNYGYVGIFQFDNPTNDLLLKIDANTFEIVDSVSTDKGAHFITVPDSGLLYLLAEGGDSIEIFDTRGETLSSVSRIEQAGPHGIASSPDGRYTYTSNLPGGGPNGLFVIDNVTNEIVGNIEGVDTPFPVPHNIVITPDGRNLFLTHSGGTSTNTSVYSLRDPSTPELIRAVDTGEFNPFGLGVTARPADDLSIGTDLGDTIRVANGHDVVFGGSGQDTVFGGSGNDRIFGESGNDRLFGNTGDDVIVGGTGRDLVSGGNGDDILIGVDVQSLTPGFREVDRLLGGRGADTYVLGDALTSYYEGLGRAQVQDFSAEEGDIIRLHGSSAEYFTTVDARGTQIFRRTGLVIDESNVEIVIDDSNVGIGSDLIARVRNVFDLDLNSDSFEYSFVSQGETLPPPAL